MALILLLTLLWSLAAQVLSNTVNRSSLLLIPDKPRVFILSDISNEPDDQESLTRYLLYSNQFKTEGICAVTSTWLQDEVHPEAMLAVIDAYGNVTHNLNQHAPLDAPYLSGEYMRSLVTRGPAVSQCLPLINNRIQIVERSYLTIPEIRHESCWQEYTTQ